MMEILEGCTPHKHHTVAITVSPASWSARTKKDKGKPIKTQWQKAKRQYLIASPPYC